MENTAILKAADFLSSDEPLLSFMIGNIRNEMTNQGSRILAKYGLTIRQILVIAYLSQHPDDIVTQKTLEDHMHLTNPTVTVLIHNMVKKELILREKIQNDGRKYRLLLTDKAKELSENACQALLSEECRFYQGFSEEDTKELFRLLDKLEKNLGFSSLSQ